MNIPEDVLETKLMEHRYIATVHVALAEAQGFLLEDMSKDTATKPDPDKARAILQDLDTAKQAIVGTPDVYKSNANRNAPIGSNQDKHDRDLKNEIERMKCHLHDAIREIDGGDDG